MACLCWLASCDSCWHHARQLGLGPVPAGSPVAMAQLPSADFSGNDMPPAATDMSAEQACQRDGDVAMLPARRLLHVMQPDQQEVPAYQPLFSSLSML
jgi:hypothetical protein